jgi:hypothetical protein
MTGNSDGFRVGAKAYRNSRDWTQEERDKLLAEANSRARSSAEVMSFTTVDNSHTSSGVLMTLLGMNKGLSRFPYGS